MTKIIPLEIAYPCLECEECEQPEFWLAPNGQIACATCRVFMDGVEWRLLDE